MPPRGDKKNSEFFDEFRLKIYERRKSSGIEDLVGTMKAIVTQVEPGKSIDTMLEMYLMTPYRYVASYLGATHKYYILRSSDDYPAMLVMEPLSASFDEYISRLNKMYPLSRATPHTRYVGEIYQCNDLALTCKTLESQAVRFEYTGEVENPFYAMDNFLFSVPSDFTGNRIGYSGCDFSDPDSLGLGDRIILSAAEMALLDEADTGSSPLC